LNSPTKPCSTEPGTSLANDDDRRDFEQELLYAEFGEIVHGLLESGQLRQKDLAARLGLGESRVSRLLKGDANTSLRSIADLGWALGYRFVLTPVPLDDRSRTPASDDPPPPPWVQRLREAVGQQQHARGSQARLPDHSRDR
jgi:transcriptional regulator with XRE-family HTH domain